MRCHDIQTIIHHLYIQDDDALLFSATNQAETKINVSLSKRGLYRKVIYGFVLEFVSSEIQFCLIVENSEN